MCPTNEQEKSKQFNQSRFGKTERGAACPDCGNPTIREDFHNEDGDVEAKISCTVCDHVSYA